MNPRGNRTKRDDGPETSAPARLLCEQSEFDSLCEQVQEAGQAAFDTEFVSDQTYRPQLCLLQVAVGERLVAVDPLAGVDLRPWWEIVADDDTMLVAHGSQAEIRFCLHATGRPPRRFVDVQLAEGLLSRSYPLSYTNLVSRVMGRRTKGRATRTDWSKRPLSEKQLDYALEDVQYLQPIWRRQQKALDRLGRSDWAWSEFDRLVADVVAEGQREPWTKLSGLNKLTRRDLAIVRELAMWREEEASRQDKLPRRVLRDDLLIDIARRHPRSESELLETRDMNRASYRRSFRELLDAVDRGLETPDHRLPKRVGGRLKRENEDEQVLGRLLGIALANRCAELELSMSLVGTTSDLVNLVRWHLGNDGADPPALMRGWREEVCGDLLVDLLDGRIALRVADVQSDHPLVFERRDP